MAKPTNESKPTTFTITFAHPRSSDTFEAEMAIDTTGQQAIDELRRAAWLPDPGRGVFALANGEASLDLARPISAQGVADGGRVQVVLTGVGAGRLAMRLNANERRSRRKLDGATLLALPTGIVTCRGAVSGIAASHGDFLNEHRVRAGDAAAWVATYRFPMLTSEQRPLSEARVLFDLADPGYPFARPSVSVISRPLPWCAHIHPVSGVVCIGEAWVEAEGQWLATQLVVHVARLLNFDEPNHSTIDGYDTSAFAYWAARAYRPLNPGLGYPALPEAIAFDLAPEPNGFRRTSGASLRRVS